MTFAKVTNMETATGLSLTQDTQRLLDNQATNEENDDWITDARGSGSIYS